MIILLDVHYQLVTDEVIGFYTFLSRPPMLSGDLETAKTILRDYINATVGFEELGSIMEISPKSLMRMFSPIGNPTATNLFGIIKTLQQKEGVHFELQAVR